LRIDRGTKRTETPLQVHRDFQRLDAQPLGLVETPVHQGARGADQLFVSEILPQLDRESRVLRDLAIDRRNISCFEQIGKAHVVRAQAPDPERPAPISGLSGERDYFARDRKPLFQIVGLPYRRVARVQNVEQGRRVAGAPRDLDRLVRELGAARVVRPEIFDRHPREDHRVQRRIASAQRVARLLQHRDQIVIGAVRG